MLKRTLLIGGSVLLIQLLVFRNYLLPIQWNQIKVQGLACTCPDETVITGSTYLRSITPDSLKKYNLDYSEIYVTERPSTSLDPMGVDQYIIKGKVIGKMQVTEGYRWNPLLKVEKWKSLDPLHNLVIKTFFGIQLLIFIVFVIRNSRG